MKKFGMIVILVIGFYSSNILLQAGTASPYCPNGPANKRLDRELSIPKNKTGSWLEINRRYKDGEPDWGNSACIDPGTACHYGDWFTWWYGMVQPSANDNCKPELIDFIPGSYNPDTGEYLPVEEK